MVRAGRRPLSLHTVARKDLVLLQSSVAHWLVAMLDCLDALHGQRPLSSRDADPSELAARLRRAAHSLAPVARRCEGTAVGGLLAELTRHADRVYGQIVSCPESASGAWLVEAHRQLHVIYADLVLCLGDELRALSLPEVRPLPRPA